ncbi:MAG: RpiB/LacA/LacB family sugar-phosphate isomerase [Prevotellaceae bacterium]|jgi:ribose 5-phosphate isomerase B|nr:RpiB/LacA/LacB family sugar-phosphate isomerase [Prevotellaceae bacterium]
MKNIQDLKIAISSDHAGFDLKESLIEKLRLEVGELKDFGCYSADSCDYPDYAHPMAFAIERGEYDFGIAICGTGNGINMTLNKHQGIRAALCWKNEIVTLVRAHNNANVIVLPGRFISKDEGYEMVKIFLTTDFEGGRHERRINKIPL